MSDNGHEQAGSERLDRIERALESMLDDHTRFREEHKQLLASQVLLTGSLELLSERLNTLTARVNTLTANVTLMQETFDARLKRLES
jgi:hypothetical protein